MCGIAGIFHFRDPERPVNTGVLQAMTRCLAHRGPDGEGLWQAPGIGLGHRRLAILDVSAEASQPMLAEAGRVVLTYNGEIYNFRDLRRSLEQEGYAFRSTGDTEVLLTAYRRWRDSVVEKVSGIFAFAIWDASRRQLLLARDPLGVKPLFYSAVGGTLRFGSEVKAVLSDPDVPRDFDREALDAFFTYGYTPAPATGLSAVRQLPPGHLLIADERGYAIRRFWRLSYSEHASVQPFADAKAEFADLLKQVTKSQMASDVPLGAFLSGGLDSAALVWAMTTAQEAPVEAFTVGFDVPSFDERPGARSTATSLGVRLREDVLSLDAPALIPKISKHLEEPTADSSALAVYLLCAGASEELTVAMSGDGADELLAGYETYRATALARYYRRIPRPVRDGLIAPLVRRLPVSDRKYSDAPARFIQGAALGPGRDHCSWRTIFSDDLKQRLYGADFAADAERLDPLAAYARWLDQVPETRGLLTRLLNADLCFYLPNDMLVKVDRMSMAHGLEVRVPYLDERLVAFCANLPDDFKLHKGRIRKHILRESIRHAVPRHVLEAPKSGFNVPLGVWFRGDLRELLLDAVRANDQQVREFLRPAAVEKLLQEHQQRKAQHGHALFSVLMFALWLDNMANAWR